MSISHALANAYSGLTAAARRGETVAHNIANATTEGYARQTVELSQRVTVNRGSGVGVDGVTRTRTEALTADRREAGAGAGGASLDAAAARTVANAVGGPDDPNALFLRYDALEKNLLTLSESPDSIAAQENASRSAVSLAEGFNGIADGILTMRARADSDIGRRVDTINENLQAIETLNRQIAREQHTGRPTAALAQERDDALDALAEHMPIRVLRRNANEVTVLSHQGVVLVDHDAHLLEFNTTTAIAADTDYRAGAGGLSGLSVNGIDITPGGGGTQGLTDGPLAALFETRDGTGVAAMAALDGLAEDLMTRFEGGDVIGAGGTGLFTDAGAALGAPPAAGLSQRLAVHAGIDPAQGGAAWRLRDGLDAAAPTGTGSDTLPTAMLDAMRASLAPPAGTGLTVPGTATGLAADLGTRLETLAQQAEDTAVRTATYHETLSDTETRAIGVDIDRELQDLLTIQTAYAANARVMEVMDQLTQRLMEI